MKAILLPLAACAALAGCVGYGGVGYADPYYGGYGYSQPGYAQPGYYYGAQPSVYIGGTYHEGHGYSDGRRGPQGDRDRDGVANRYDRDRDNDGVRNRNDARPNNPRRN
ncbi:MAG TPA: hypothetical protein VIL30_11765 [Ramlibacter sp.]|jgi:hypothetical protein